jgi:hypothetical protein
MPAQLHRYKVPGSFFYLAAKDRQGEACIHVLGRDHQVLALLAIVFRAQPGQTLEVHRQVAFTCKSHRMSNKGESPVRFVLDAPVIMLKRGIALLAGLVLAAMVVEALDGEPGTIGTGLPSLGVETSGKGKLAGKASGTLKDAGAAQRALGRVY